MLEWEQVHPLKDSEVKKKIQEEAVRVVKNILGPFPNMFNLGVMISLYESAADFGMRLQLEWVLQELRSGECPIGYMDYGPQNEGYHEPEFESQGPGVADWLEQKFKEKEK